MRSYLSERLTRTSPAPLPRLHLTPGPSPKERGEREEERGEREEERKRGRATLRVESWGFGNVIMSATI
jgi:hypothetical protein